jgi:hypothetical protein
MFEPTPLLTNITSHFVYSCEAILAEPAIKYTRTKTFLDIRDPKNVLLVQDHFNHFFYRLLHCVVGKNKLLRNKHKIASTMNKSRRKILVTHKSFTKVCLPPKLLLLGQVEHKQVWTMERLTWRKHSFYGLEQ